MIDYVVVAEIARRYLGFKTLDTRNSDIFDFKEVAVWNVKEAIAQAYQAGFVAGANQKPLDETNTKWHPVKSSTIKAIAHNTVTEILSIEFLNGSIYDYRNVTNGAFHDMLESDSKGRFFANVIKPHCPAAKIQ